MKKIEILKLDTPNKNGIIFTTEEVQRAIEHSGQFYGQIGESGDSDLYLEKISHRVEKLRIEDGILYGDMTILDTMSGNVLRNLFQEKQVSFGMSYFGNVSLSSTVTDMQIVSINAISTYNKA